MIKFAPASVRPRKGWFRWLKAGDDGFFNIISITAGNGKANNLAAHPYVGDRLDLEMFDMPKDFS